MPIRVEQKERFLEVAARVKALCVALQAAVERDPEFVFPDELADMEAMLAAAEEALAPWRGVIVGAYLAHRHRAEREAALPFGQ